MAPLVNLLMDASMGIADYQCRNILRDNYRRLAPVFPPATNIKMDDWQRADYLFAFGTNAPLADPAAGNAVVPWLRQVGW